MDGTESTPQTDRGVRDSPTPEAMLPGLSGPRPVWSISGRSRSNEEQAPSNSFFCLIDEVVSAATGRAVDQRLSGPANEALQQLRRLSAEEVAAHLGPALASLGRVYVELLDRSRAEQEAEDQADDAQKVMDGFLGHFLQLLEDLHSLEAVEALLAGELGRVISPAAPALVSGYGRS